MNKINVGKVCRQSTISSSRFMLKPKPHTEELKILRSSLMTGAEIRMTYATTKCCNKLNCIQNLICGGPSDFSSSSSNSRFDNNSLYCQQIGVMPDEEIPALAFDQFLKEIRQPFHALQAGAGSDEEASKQLRWYLVQKFTENRTYDPENKHNFLYICINYIHNHG